MEEVRAISSHWSMKSRNTKHAYAKVRVMQTVFTNSSMALKPIRLSETRVLAEVTVLYFQMLLKHLKHSSHYTYYQIQHSETLDFAHTVYLCV